MTADLDARRSRQQALLLENSFRIPGFNFKDAALAAEDLLRQGFQCDELAPERLSGDGSLRSNGGMHRGVVVQSAGWTGKTKKVKIER